MKKYLYVGSYISIFLIFIASIIGIAELDDDYSSCKLLLSLNALFATIMLFLVEKYSNYVTIHDASNHTTINEHSFRGIFHTWIGLTLIGTTEAGLVIAIIVILFGIWNLVYNIKYNHTPPPEIEIPNLEDNLTQ